MLCSLYLSQSISISPSFASLKPKLFKFLSNVYGISSVLFVLTSEGPTEKFKNPHQWMVHSFLDKILIHN